MEYKKPSSKDVILEEYVDCLHFILSIGIEKNFEDITLNTKYITCELSEQFLNLYINISDFIICSSIDNYLKFFRIF